MSGLSMLFEIAKLHTRKIPLLKPRSVFKDYDVDCVHDLYKKV